MAVHTKTAALLISTLLLLLIIAATPLQTTACQTAQITKGQYDNGTITIEMARPPSTSWAKTFGGTGYDWATSVQQTSDGGYIVAGATLSLGASYSDLWLVKTDGSGNMVWNKTYGGTLDDWATSVQQTSDRGCIVAGDTYSFGAGGEDSWLLKLNSVGTMEWNKTYGGTSNDWASSVQQTSDGGYIIAGATESFGAGGYDFWIVKTNGSGTMEWNRTYGGTSNDYASSVQQTSDGGYIVAGYTFSFGAGYSDFWLVKIGSVGNMEWNGTYGGTNYDWASSVQQTSDGGYIIAGATMSFGAGSYDFWIVKTNGSGTMEWNRTYGGTRWDEALSIQQTSDGGYITVGDTYSFGAGGEDSWLVKVDSVGNMVWNKTYGGALDDGAQSIQQTSDGGYIIAGTTSSFGAGKCNFWLVKINEDWPPSAITDLVAGSPTDRSITLTWTAPGDDGMKGNATGYLVKYSTTGSINASNWDSATNYTENWEPLPAGHTETHVVPDLIPNTKYWFAVMAYDDFFNYGDVSNSPSATTARVDLAPLIFAVAVVVGAPVMMVEVALYMSRRR